MPPRALALLLVAAGSALGGVLRYTSGRWAGAMFGSRFPLGTLLINLAGSFLLGLLVAVLVQRDAGGRDEALYLALGVGFCGGFTTFSAFELETSSLLQTGGWLRAVAYVLLSVLVGLLALRLGALCGRALLARG